VTHEFQTNPRGVEASSRYASPSSVISFRRTLVGLKPSEVVDVLDTYIGFRRTLVGLKLFFVGGAALMSKSFQTNPRGVEAPADRLRPRRDRRFQTNPRGVEARARLPTSRNRRVSDEPSWG